MLNNCIYNNVNSVNIKKGLFMRNRILVIPGSNSQRSINRQLGTYAAAQLEDPQFDVLDLNDYDMPIYGIDKERSSGIPEKAHQLRTLLDQYDGYIIALAEHNGSYASAFKNIIDWLSRIEKKIWSDKPVLLMSATPGPLGGKNVLTSAQSYFPRLGANIVDVFSFGRFKDHFSEKEGIVDSHKKSELIEKLRNFEKEVEVWVNSYASAS